MTHTFPPAPRRRLPPWRLLMWGAIAALLVLPLLAMQVTREVNWDAADFAAAAVLLVGAGAAFEGAVRVTARPIHRALLGALILGVVLVVWAEAAVGVF